MQDGTRWRYFVGQWGAYGIAFNVRLDPVTDYGDDQNLKVREYVLVIYDEYQKDGNGVYHIAPGHVYILNWEQNHSPNCPV